MKAVNEKPKDMKGVVGQVAKKLTAKKKKGGVAKQVKKAAKALVAQGKAALAGVVKALDKAAKKKKKIEKKVTAEANAAAPAAPAALFELAEGFLPVPATPTTVAAASATVATAAKKADADAKAADAAAKQADNACKALPAKCKGDRKCAKAKRE